MVAERAPEAPERRLVEVAEERARRPGHGRRSLGVATPPRPERVERVVQEGRPERRDVVAALAPPQLGLEVVVGQAEAALELVEEQSAGCADRACAARIEASDM